LEAKLAQSRAASSYAEFRELTDPAAIHIGFRKNETRGAGLAVELQGVLGELTGSVLPDGGSGSADGGGLAGLAAGEVSLPDDYLLWLIVPAPNRESCAVEFAQADSATFVYRCPAGFSSFAQQLNRALEAINFKREVIWMSEDELAKPENADYLMASRRTPALQLVRATFAGRVIHQSSWKQKLLETWDVPALS
jgi:hypothetical protein